MINDGKTKTSDNECHTENACGGLGIAERKSGIHGDDSNKILNSNSERGDKSRGQNSDRERSSPGGIESQLREIKQSHLAFIEARQQQLKDELVDNQGYSEKLLLRIENLESKLKQLNSHEKPS